MDSNWKLSLDEWDDFLDFTKKESRNHLRLWGQIDENTLNQYLSFHAIYGNLYITKDGDGWAFAVVRPVLEDNIAFNWDQPDSEKLLLDVLFSRTKLATLRLLKLYLDSGRCIDDTFYYRKGSLKKWTISLTKRFFYGF